MRPVRILLAAFLALALAASARAEEIRRMDVEVRLFSTAEFEVTERILYDFGAVQKHGIFRLIPVRYGRGAAPDYRIHLDVKSVTDERGQVYPTKLTREGPNLKIRVGDADRTVTGEHEYRIVYRVRRGILYFDDHDEIYWNATGTDWPVPIGSALARVILPPGADDEKARFACYTGPFGAIGSECDASRESGAIVVTARRPLGVGEGLTFVVGLPKGILREPSRLDRFLARVSDAVSPWMMLPLAAFLGMLHLWRTRGRDPAGADAIPVRYEPPEGLSPAQVGTILDERADMTDLTATILDLAVRGYLTIEETESAKFLFFSSKDYRLTRTDAPATPLKQYESKMLNGLFEGGNTILVSSLKNSFYRKLSDLRQALYESLSKEGSYFPTSPDRVKTMYLVAAFVMAVLGVPLLFAGSFGPMAGVSVLATAVIVAAFAPFMPRRTPKGRQAYQEILGFKEFMERVDAQRLERMGGRTAENFEKVLPFAIVLGAADQWADAFADIYTQPPRWYTSSHAGSFSPRIFVSDVGSSLKTIGATMTSSPGGSGSSGFGGGSSGGGFGGGGGGSW